MNSTTRSVRANELVRGQARRVSDSMTTNLKGGDIRFRLVAMWCFITAMLLVVLLRVTLLQTVWAGGYQQASINQRTRVNIVRAERGSILDRQGFELALPVPTRTIFADPRVMTDPVGTANALAGLLQLTPEKEIALAASLQNNKSSFAYVARQSPQDVANAILALKLPGISSYIESSRSLTSETLRAVVGRTDPDGIGISGLEKQFNDVLAGVDGRSVREVNSDGQSIAAGSNDSQSAVRGHDVITTIDRNIQFQVDGIVNQQIQRIGARSGTAIVMDSATGEIYAMTSIRRNANGTYSSDSGNFAAVEAYEPGSVAKVFSVASAINEQTITPASTFKVPGIQVFDKGTQWEYTIKDAYPHALEDMTVRKIIVDSSNLGAALISQTMTTQTSYDYLKAFGFGAKTDLGFPNEASGALKPAKKWQGTEKITSSYGYGYAATALQLVSAVNVVANDGVYVAPRISSATINGSGINTPTPPSATHRVLTSESAQTMRSLLTDVVCFGTGKYAKVQGMSVGGKTGTGYKLQDNGTYTTDEGTRAYFASFVGFLPADKPRFTVLVSIDEPDPASQDRFGATAAA
ncbi:MAG: peptidoglycan D,D-transpeptidase FtsI family protein, partial [Ilumatobacteraceae bacterium]